MAAVVLPPCELSVEKADIDRRHLLLHVVVGRAKVLRAEQPECRARRDRGHEAALLIEPFRVALLGHAVADERRTRRAQRQQLMRIDRQIAGVPCRAVFARSAKRARRAVYAGASDALASEARFGCAVFQEVPAIQ